MRDHRDRTIRPRREGGFTLAEVLIASTVSMIVLIGLYLLYDVNQATLIRGEQQTDLQQNARIGMDRIVRELRLVGSDPSGTLSGVPAIPGATTSCPAPPAALQAIETAEGYDQRIRAISQVIRLMDKAHKRRKLSPVYQANVFPALQFLATAG